MTIKPERTKADRGSGASRTAGDGELDTRYRGIKAAVECIIESPGFYRGSSTNEIARKAGVTWGVIQWYFGNREGLMLAVLEDGASHMIETVKDADIEGETVAERMSQLVDVFLAHYARPAYLASLQVMLNMDHDPRTSADVRKTMREVAERSHTPVRRLLREALGAAAEEARSCHDDLSRDSWFRLQPATLGLHGLRHCGPEARSRPPPSAAAD